ncbi:MAG: cell division control protein Cdc6 [Spirochaetes bacterium]|nr:MAG: cell division control protein Cdc6 [Spirochaetota bacterium]
MQTSLNEIFQNYVNKKPLFKDKNILTINFTPDNIPHRDKQLEQIALILAPVLRNEKPSNVFIYGKTGTGKTLVITKIMETLKKSALKYNISLKIIYVNCKMRKVADTEYRLLAQLISCFNETVPYTGLPTNELYDKFFRILDSVQQNVIVVLDEIDVLVNKIGSDILYNITRINQELKNTKLTLVGISNNISFMENLDPRVKSSLSEEEIIFPPYNATELKDILTERVKEAFHENTVSSGVISKCAALAAQEHGDARRALDLLRVAGEIAERLGSEKISEVHVDMAQQKLDTDRILETIKTQPKQSQAVFKAILNLYRKGERNIQTGDVYDLYSQICKKNNLIPLTQRRVSDLISELDTLGIINATVLSKGRYGRTRKINLNMPNQLINKLDEILSREFI